MAKIEPLTEASAYLDLLERSGLLAPEVLAAIRKSAAGQGDATSLARSLAKEGKLTKWQAQQLLYQFSGFTVGKYRLLDQIGRGPMGRVYLAEHGKLNKKVSLKLLPSRLGSQPDVLKRFLDEANRAGALNHRNIIHIFDVGKDDDGRYYLAMEHVEGKDVQRLVDASGPLGEAQAINLTRQAAEGLAHAHEQKLTHGDLKPSCLLVDAGGVVKILDLGLAELTNRSAASGTVDESSEAPTLASLAFRAPELLANNRRPDVRSDLYSLGAILYFLLTGKPPARDESDVAAALLKVPGVSPELANICDHLLAAEPQDRPESAAQIVAALELAARAASSAEKGAGKPAAERPSSAGKPKRPLVAKALDEPVGQIVVVSEDEPTASPSGDPLAGFAIKTGRKRPPASRPAAEPAATISPAAGKPIASKSTSRLPLILGAAIGGGLVVIAGLVTILLVVLNRGGTQQLAKVNEPAAAAKSEAAGPDKEAKAETADESNPDTNPVVAAEDVESKAVVPPVAGAKGDSPPPTASAPEKSPVSPPAAKGTADAPPASTNEPAPPAGTPTPTPAPTKGPPPPSEVKAEPAKSTPAPTPMPAAGPAPAPVGNPFQGFAATVSLPPLEAMGKPAEGALAPLPLGPVKIEPTALCIIKLKGGETAYKAKTKFLLEPANQGTAERDWELKLQSDSDAPLVIATLSLKENQLVYQWAEEATRQQAAPYLCNCVLSLSAGAGTHQVALRKPVVVEPLAAEVEKGAINEKFNLEFPPGGKQITVELGPLSGGPPKHKVDPKTELEAFKDTTYLFTGNADDALILGFKIDVSMPARTLQIVAQPQFLLHGMAKPERYLKTTASRLGELFGGQIQAAQFAGQIAARNPKADLKKQQETQAKGALELAQKNMAQVEQLKEIAKSLQAGGKIHFRAYYLADDAKVELVNTGAPPPPPAPMPAKK